MTRIVLLRGLLIVALTGLAVVASWAIPKLGAPPDRFGVAMQLIDQGRAADAIYLLKDKPWRGVAEYRAGRYQRALYAWITENGADDLYNIGNAYARLHNWAGAKSAYRRALRLNPSHEDAIFNLALVEKAEQAEKALEEDTRVTREMGKWKEGDRDDPRDGKEAGTDVEKGAADKGDTKPTDARTAEAGESEGLGQLGEKPPDLEMKSGASGGKADEIPPDGLKAGEGRVLILRESAQAAEVLLRQIRDDPARVLRARLRAAHKARQEREGACKGC